MAIPSPADLLFTPPKPTPQPRKVPAPVREAPALPRLSYDIEETFPMRQRARGFSGLLPARPRVEAPAAPTRAGLADVLREVYEPPTPPRAAEIEAPVRARPAAPTPPGLVRFPSAVFEHLIERPLVGLAELAWTGAGFLWKGVPPEQIVSGAKAAAGALKQVAQDPEPAKRAIGRFGIDQWRNLVAAWREDPYSTTGAALGEGLLWLGVPLVQAYRTIKGTGQVAEIMRGYGQVADALGVERELIGMERGARAIRRAGVPPTGAAAGARPVVAPTAEVSAKPLRTLQPAAVDAMAKVYEREALKALSPVSFKEWLSRQGLTLPERAAPPKAPAPIPRAARVTEVSRPTPGVTLEPSAEAVASARRLRQAAEVEAPTFLRDIKEVASGSGARFATELERHAVKGVPRMAEKITAGRPVSDVLRGTVEISDARQVDRVVDGLRQRGYRVAEVRNRWTDPRDATWVYKDIQIKAVKAEGDPVVREVLLITPAILKAKVNGGHDVYTAARQLERLGDRFAGDAVQTARIQRAKRALEGTSNAVYRTAFEADRAAVFPAASSISRPTSTRAARAAGVSVEPPRVRSEISPETGLPKTYVEPTSARRVSSAVPAPAITGPPLTPIVPPMVPGVPRAAAAVAAPAARIRLSQTAEVRRGLEENRWNLADFLQEWGAVRYTPEGFEVTGREAARIARRLLKTEAPIVPPPRVVAPPPPPVRPIEPTVAAVAPVQGTRVRVATPTGAEIEADYAVVSARSLRTSHDTALRPNPEYPAGLQPRMRERAASQRQLDNFVQKTRIEELGESVDTAHGAPIIGDDLVVESGNLRSIGLLRLYEVQNENTTAYRRWLAGNAERFGVSPQAVEAVPDPVLVRIRRTPVDRARFVREANMGTTLKMSPVEVARSDALIVPDDLMRSFVPGETGEVATPANRNFIRQVIRIVAPTPEEQGDLLMPNGALSANGIRRIQNMTLAKAYGDVGALEKLIEAPDVNVRNIANALLMAAPKVAEMRGAISRGELYNLDISSDVARAMTKLSDLRESGTPVELYLSQTWLVPDATMTPEAQRLLEIFDVESKSRKRIAEFIGEYVDRARAVGDPRQVGLLGGRPLPTKLDLIEVVRGAETPQLQGALFEGAPVRAAARHNRNEAKALLAQQSQAGFIRFGARPAAPTGLSPETEYALTIGRQAEGVRGATARAKQWIGERVRYEGLLGYVENLPRGVTKDKVVNDFRLFKNRVQALIPSEIADQVASVVQPLQKADYDAFRTFVFLREWNEEAQVAARQGRRPSIPFGITPQTVAADLATAEARLRPEARAAVVRHDRLMKSVTDDLIQRDVLDPAEAREFYLRHFVMAYDDIYGPGVAIPRRFREPFRQYAKGRTGSERPIRTDYLEVVTRQLSRVYVDNAVDDFMQQTIKRADLLPTLSKQEAIALFGPSGKPNRVGQIVEVNGKSAMTWQYHPGSRLYPAKTVTEDLVAAATANALTKQDIEQLAGKAAALGRKWPIVLIDPKLAQRLGQFNIPTKGDMFPKVNAYTSVWKRTLLDLLGLPFHVRNLSGDLENMLIVAGDPRAARNLFYATRVLLDKAGPEGERILQLAREQAVVSSGLVSGNIRRAIVADPRFAFLRDLPEGIAGAPVMAGRLLEKAVTAYEYPWRVREDAVRLAKFITDVKRIERGESAVYSGAITGMEGLSEIEKAGRVARVAMIDYGGKSRFEQGMGEVLAPFITFFYQNTPNWMRLARRDPKRLAAPVAIYATMTLWNNTGNRRQVEESLPFWMRVAPHMVTGWTTGDGRPLVVRITPLGASQSAAEVTGLDKVGDALVQALKGTKTPEEAAWDAAAAIGGAPIRFGQQALGPLVRAGAATLGKDVWTGADIIPERLRGTPEARWRLAGRVAEELAPPYGMLQRYRRDVGVGEVPGLADIAMRAGILKAPDVEAEQLRRVREAARGAEAGYEQQMYEVEHAYLDSDGDLRQAIQVARDRRLPTSGDQIRRRLLAPRVQIALARERLKRTTDQTQRDRLLERIRVLRDIQGRQAIQQTPRGVRPQVIPTLRPTPAIPSPGDLLPTR